MDKKGLATDSMLLSVYTSHLQGALGFYHNLLVRLRNRYCIALQGVIDWIGIPPDSDIHQKVTKDQMEWAFKACQRCLIYLGDIARYQLDVSSEPNPRHAERYYHLAILLNPAVGMPHNQIGTLKQSQSELCESCYHYMRCLMAPSPFEGAEENVKRVLEKHNVVMTELQATCLKNNTLIDTKTQFTAAFLSLQEVLFGLRKITNEELGQWCQSVISLFSLILNEKLQISHSPTPPITNGVGGGHQYRQHQEHESLHVVQEDSISSGMLLKMMGMTILDIVKLKKKGSDIGSAAVAFASTLLSELLSFISNYMKQAYPALDSEKGKDQFSKMRNRIIMSQRKRRRRRKFSSQSSDHSNSDDEHLIFKQDEDLSDLSEGELDQDFSDTLSEDSDSVIEETSDAENDLEVERIVLERGARPPINGKISKSERENLSSLSKAGLLLNKQLKKENNKMHLNSLSNGIVHDFTLEHVDFINQAACLLEDFEKINNEAFLPVVKVLFDWLRINPDILKTSGKAAPVLWQRIADVLNILPSQKVVHTTVMYFSQRRRLPLWLRGDLEDGVEKPQKRALPEDITFYGAPGFEDLHKSLDIKWFRGLTNSELYQFALRVTYLRNFGHFISNNTDVPCFSWDEKTDRFMVDTEQLPQPPAVTTNHQHMNGHADHTHSNGNSITTTPAAPPHPRKTLEQRNEMMKALAKQKLKHEVSEMQMKLKTEEHSVYLVLDTPALCRHLSLLRTLVKSSNFVVIVPIQVIAALDELKKYNPGARDAIKFLEDEIKHGNRWLKTQKEHETITDALNSKKKKNRDVEEWRFIQVVKCCIYFAEKHQENSSPTPIDHTSSNMVTLLTSDSSIMTSPPGNSTKMANLGTRVSQYALDICKTKGIRVEPVVDFYKRWTTRNGPP
uniref:Protein SMG5 n=2 Tax=Clytia hemisphaerica TaxID=252671 RepID=A0A7M5WZX7_9CNID